MTFSLTDDAALASAIATEAGALLIALRRDRGGDCGLAGDQAANALILARLAAARPNDCVLSEEAPDDLSRCAANRVWIVDPLDGTREYAEGRDDWAVHVGLAVAGVPVAGAVAVPMRGVTYDSAMVWPPPTPARTRLRLLVSRTRPPTLAAQVAVALGADLVPMGSAGVKAMAVVAGEADLYLHTGGQSEWDNCAPVAVALAAGLHAAALDGEPLGYNRPVPVTPDFLICRPELTGPALAALLGND